MKDDDPKLDPAPAAGFPVPRLPQRAKESPKFEPSDTSKLRTKKQTVRINLPPERASERGVQLSAAASKPARAWWRFWERSE